MLAGEDVQSTARVLRQLGASITAVRDGAQVRVTGRRWHRPTVVLHCGNSGTTARLMLGLLAGQALESRLTGDRSLRRRPMRRVTEPLRAMGADIAEGPHDALPLTIRGGKLHPFT
jgi:3-phosphoshikimate 1-carboxyvinyltransferase